MGFDTIVIQKTRELGGRECQWVLQEVEAPKSHPPLKVGTDFSMKNYEKKKRHGNLRSGKIWKKCVVFSRG